MPKTTQAKASILRQLGALAVSAYGVLSAAGVANHLPAWCAGILTAAGPVVIAVEHYVSDPSTGNAKAIADAVGKETELAKLRGDLGELLSKAAGLLDLSTPAQSAATLPRVPPVPPSSIGGAAAAPTP